MRVKWYGDRKGSTCVCVVSVFTPVILILKYDLFVANYFRVTVFPKTLRELFLVYK
jgi:hypothetical protein